MAYADSASDLPMLEAVGLPGGRQPRGASWRRSPVGAAGTSSTGRRQRAVRGRRSRSARSTGRRRRGRYSARRFGTAGRRSLDRRRRPRPWSVAVKALVFERNLPRFAASRVASLLGSGRGAGVGPLRLLDADPPERPAADWHQVRPLLSGICGSDLATLDGRSSRYFEDLVSFPFVPGHEVVGVVDDGGHATTPAVPLAAGARVVVEPVLGCAPAGHRARRVPTCAGGHTGLTASTSPSAHLGRGCRPASAPTPAAAGRPPGSSPTPRSSTRYPTRSPTRTRCTVEPTACAVHAVALRRHPSSGTPVAVRRCRHRSGSPSIAALDRPGRGRRSRARCRRWSAPSTPHQRRARRVARRRRGRRPRPAGPGRPTAEPAPSSSVPAARAAHRRGRRGLRLRRLGPTRSPRPAGHGPAAGPGGAGRHARPGLDRPGPALAPRAHPRRCLRLRDRAVRPATRPRRSAPSSWPSTWSPSGRTRLAGLGAPTRSSATRRPSPTPARPAAAVRSRWPSTSGTTGETRKRRR